MVDISEEKLKRMCEFFVGAQLKGYSLSDARSLLLNSGQGQV